MWIRHCIISTFCYGKMDFQMQLHNEDSNSCSAKKKKRRNRKTKVSCGSNNTHQEGDSLVQDVLLQKDSCVESTANVSSNSGLIEVQSNSNMNCSENKRKVKKEKWKRLKAQNAVNRDVVLQEVASETKTAPFKIEAPVDESIKPVLEKDSYVEPTANLSSNSGLIEVQPNSNLNFSENKNKRKRERNKGRKAQKADNTDVDLHEVASETKTAPFRIEAPVDESIKPVSEKDLCVEPAANLSSNSGLTEVQSNSNLNFSENKNKRKRERKKRRNALEADNTDVDLHKVASETKTAPFRIEALVDECIKPVSESTPLEVDVPDDLNKKMDSVAASVEIVAAVGTCTKTDPVPNLTLVQKRKMQKEKRKQRHKSIEHDAIDHVHPEDNSVTKNTVLEKDTSSLPSVNMFLEKQPNGQISLCLEMNEVKELNDGHNDLNKKMVSVAASVEIEAAVGTSTKTDPVPNLTRVQKRKMQKEKRKPRHKSLEHDAIDHVHPEDNSLTKNTVLEKDTSSLPSVNMFSEKQPNGQISLCLEMNEVKDLNDGHNDLNKKMVSVAASVEIEAAVGTITKTDPVPNLTRVQKRKMQKEKRKQRHKSLEHDAIDHVHPEDNSLTKNTVLEKDTSSLPSVNMFSEKQPNGQISLCPEMNEVKELNDGHNDSENKSLANFHMDNAKPYEKKDVKFAPAVAELDSTTVKEDLQVSEKLGNSSKIEDTSLLEKHDVHAESVNIYKRKKIVETYSRKKRRESSDSGENNCIKEDGTGFTSFGHSEEPHVTGFSENKLDIELERKNDASVQVLEDIMMREALVDCSDGKLVCKDNENRMEKKILKEDEENFEQKNGRKLKKKTSDTISGFDTFYYHQVQMNAEVETNVGVIFSSSSHLGVTKDVVDVTGKEDNLLQKSHPSPKRVSRCKKKLLVLDVNGLLADIVPYASYGYKPDIMISKKSVFKRPYCDDFLRFCFERFNVGIWSSRIKKNVEKVIEFLMGDSRRNLHFIWDAYHCSKTGLNTIENKDKPLVLKELKKLWDKVEPDLPWEKGEYNETNTLLLDDSPYKALRNPAHTAIFPYSYKYNDSNDCSLGPGGDLRVYLEGLAAAGNVQEYVQQNPFGQRAITESNPSWGFYSKIVNIKPSRPHNNSSTSVADSHVVSRMSLEETYIYESGFGSK
ncbi:hypothetical protein Q3G72_009051 [Acer saccharum]|nr:hypothetical protein Q3G72_009051 [Acer saccharum]